MPHTQTTREYVTCAYTQKVLKFCDMMNDGGYDVVLYSGEENEARCAEHVQLISERERFAWFGRWEQNALPTITWQTTDSWWATMNARAIVEVASRKEKGDVLCLIAGTAQEPIARFHSDLLPTEWGIGYEGVFSDFRVYESYAWMHYLYGKLGQLDGRFFDDVIPNFFDPLDFGIDEKEDYLLFVGRLVKRKGPDIASLIAERAGMRLVVAGTGGTLASPGHVIAPEVELKGDHIDYIGPVDAMRRAEVMARASAILVPTQYIGPFEGVSVEAMLCGTPAITTDWGCFAEYVETGITGYRFRTLGEAAEMVDAAKRMNPDVIRQRAVSRYSLEAVFPRYDRFFKRLAKLHKGGWYD